MRHKDLTGIVFGRLTAIKRVYKNGEKRTIWACKCSCGKTTEVWSYSLIRGNTRSCGCIRVEKSRGMLFKHGLSSHDLFTVWVNMRRRCEDAKDKSYPRYGGRGITVCDRWSEFMNFFNDVASGYSKGMSIDRIDNDGPYSPDNCKWSTSLQQARNKQNTIRIDSPWGHIPIKEASELSGIPYKRLFNRHKAGWSTDRIFNLPAHQKGGKKEDIHILENGKTVVEMAREHGLDPSTVLNRIRRGWPKEKWFIPLTR